MSSCVTNCCINDVDVMTDVTLPSKVKKGDVQTLHVEELEIQSHQR